MKHIILATALFVTGCQSAMEAVLLPSARAERECYMRDTWQWRWDGSKCVATPQQRQFTGPYTEPMMGDAATSAAIQKWENQYGPQQYSGEYWAAAHGTMLHPLPGAVSTPPPLYQWAPPVARGR